MLRPNEWLVEAPIVILLDAFEADFGELQRGLAVGAVDGVELVNAKCCSVLEGHL